MDNISLGGCFVRCPTPLAVGTEVKLEIHRPGASAPIPVFGRVVSSAAARPGHPPGMGIAFAPMPRETSQRIEGLVGAVDPMAVRAHVLPSETRTDPAIPVLMPAPPTAVELEELREHLKALQDQVARKDHRIAELEAQVERLKQRLLLYGGRM